jgi:hypothetical protein
MVFKEAKNSQFQLFTEKFQPDEKFQFLELNETYITSKKPFKVKKYSEKAVGKS